MGSTGCHDDLVYLVCLVGSVCLERTGSISLMQSIQTMDHFVKSLKSTDPIHQNDEIDQMNQADLLLFLFTWTRAPAQNKERPDGQDSQPERRIPV